ncbi:hypothetical protein cym2001_40860 [Pseudomonas sp. CYM-20-01]|nr:hypothetical protein cym2001_40860 [Pseudomonas sp. CYM-20-01]
MKLMQTITSALIPVDSVIENPDLNKIPALLGLVLLIMEGIQQLNRYQQVWTTYRSTYVALKHEKYTYLSSAVPYARVDAPEALLADRIEGLISQKHAKWVATINSSKPEKR